MKPVHWCKIIAAVTVLALWALQLAVLVFKLGLSTASTVTVGSLTVITMCAVFVLAVRYERTCAQIDHTGK